LGTDLAAALGRGDRDKSRKLIDKLPDWKARSRLRDAADGTTDLRRHAVAAAQAGVPSYALDPLHDVVGRNEQVIVAVARKIASLGGQSNGSYRKLPPDARALVENDVRRLEAMTRVSGSARKSLAVATAAVDSGDAAGAYDALEAFGRALRELSGA
jgi:hypothetical protein